jgi:O-succinylbenzoic acid--CoA ligase
MAFWIALAAGKHPERVAIELEERAITYAALSQRAIEGCRWLQGRDVRAGERVALEIEDRFEFALALHACLLTGAPAVPVDLRLGEEERAARRAGSEVVLRDWPAADIPAWAMPGMAHPVTDAVATVMHTSGTTSAPKPVELTDGNWLANALGSAVALGLDPAERWLCPMPLTHVGGLSILIRSVIYATTAVLHDRFDAGAVTEELMDPARRITLVSLVPTMLSRLLDAGLEGPPTLRWALLGGAPIPPALLERAADAGVPVAPTYGMTEGCSQLFTFGFPLPGVEFRLAGPDGEIEVRGPMIAPGALDQDGWLHTGDLGRIDERGRLEIVGRRSDTIITGGENVAPQEVESVLQAHPSVADAAVVGRADPEWGQALVALILARNGGPVDLEELRSHCRARLAAFKVPKRFELVDGLPRTPSGKLLRRELG